MGGIGRHWEALRSHAPPVNSACLSYPDTAPQWDLLAILQDRELTVDFTVSFVPAPEPASIYEEKDEAAQSSQKKEEDRKPESVVETVRDTKDYRPNVLCPGTALGQSGPNRFNCTSANANRNCPDCVVRHRSGLQATSGCTPPSKTASWSIHHTRCYRCYRRLSAPRIALVL